jgi:REP element-mobilizing transposase RayT
LTGIGDEIAGMIDYSNDRYGICPIVQPVIMPNRIHLILTIGVK